MSADEGLVAMLLRDHARMRVAGGGLAEAAIRVIHDYDGMHRLSLAVANWANAIAAEGDRPFALAAGAQSAETSETSAQSEGRQSGAKQSPNPIRKQVNMTETGKQGGTL